MTVGSISLPEMPSIEGFQLNAVSAGIKSNEQLDLVLMSLPEGSTAAGVFTQNAFAAAPVHLCKAHLAKTNRTRYLLINSGNANACTGVTGEQAAQKSCEVLSEIAEAETESVLPFSTGVIGEPLPIDKITQALPDLVNGLSENHWQLAAKGIMTTDTQPKAVSHSFEWEGETIVINGIAKGAGMIRPNMATMLAYVATNLSINDELLCSLLHSATNQSFNRITIDGDTSTNDSCILMSTNQTNTVVVDTDSELFKRFQYALHDVFKTLAQYIVRDGEGATKFASIIVEEGAMPSECLDVAYAIANSPLVKTALFASDPNWGRIVCAIGYAGLTDLDTSNIHLYLNNTLIVENGGRADSYTEEAGQKVMDQEEIVLRVCLGRGDAKEEIWTSDLSHEYVRINAEYRS